MPELAAAAAAAPAPLLVLGAAVPAASLADPTAPKLAAAGLCG